MPRERADCREPPLLPSADGQLEEQMTTMPLRIGVVGCGNISDVYIANAPRLGGYRVVACSDVDHDRAAAKSRQHGIPTACSFQSMLRDPAVDLILNLTPPAFHASVALAALEAGKHVYNEKPLACDLDDGHRLVEFARKQGLFVGCAPDTFLGAGYQTCRRLVDQGAIGQPVGAVGFMMCRGPELWHPDPAVFYRRGAGPLFDMGPYYISALVSLFGPVRRVAAIARVTFAEREIVSLPRRGERFAVETPTTVSASLEFTSGPVATLVMSFDIWSHSLPCIELYGSEGTISAPDPNTFGGPVKLRERDEPAGRDLALDEGYADNSRGIGVCDLAEALATGREPRAGGELALHVLEVMHAILDSDLGAESKRIHSQPHRPSAVPARQAE